MSSEDLVSPVIMDGFVLQSAQQRAPRFSHLHSQPDTPSPEPDTLVAGAVAPATDVAISRAAQFYSELQLLQSQNPDQYKQVLTSIVDTLNAAIPNTKGAEQTLLTQLTDQFQQAADGDLSALQLSPPPVSADLPANPVPSTSGLGNLVTPQEQNALNLNLLALQAQETPVSLLISLPAQDSLTTSSLLAAQEQLLASFGDLFLPQTHIPVKRRGVVAIYGPHHQLLTEAFPSQEAAAYQPPFSTSTQQVLNAIFNTLHNALFGVSTTASTGSTNNS